MVKCFGCGKNNVKERLLNLIQLHTLCWECAMEGFDSETDACENRKVIKDEIAYLDKKKLQKQELELFAKKKSDDLFAKGVIIEDICDAQKCGHSWGVNANGSDKPMSLRESVLMNYQYKRGNYYYGSGSEREEHLRFEHEENMFKKRSLVSSVVKRAKLAPIAEFIHPVDPVMALGFLENCEFVEDKYTMKSKFQENCDLLDKVCRVEGVRIASFLFPEKVASPFKFLDDAFEIVDNLNTIESELGELIGSEHVEEFIGRSYFKHISKSFQKFKYEGGKRALQNIAKEMVYFAKTCEQNDIKSRRLRIRSLIHKCPVIDKYSKKYWSIRHYLVEYLQGKEFHCLQIVFHTFK